MTRISFGSRITTLAEQDPDAPAVVCADATLTRGDLERAANRLARVYAERGVGEGDLVTLCLPNGIEFFVHSLAAWKLGAVPNPLSARLPRRERDVIVKRADPALLIGIPDDEANGRPTLAAHFEPDESVSDAPHPDRTAPHERALASGGSTGVPKLILPMHPASYDPDAPSELFHSHTATLVPGPLDHAVPFSAGWQAILGGAKAIVLPRFDASCCLEQIERHRIDRAFFVPTMLLRIWRLPEAERIAHDLSSLEFVMTGGAPMPAWLMRAWIEWLGPDVMNEAFGPSERIGGTRINGREWLEHPGSVGRPSVGSKIRILDPDSGRDLAPGEMGEIYMMPATGSGSTYRYVGARAMRNEEGWETVGDMGWLDGDGYLFLGDRRSDMILTGGRNVYPAEVEAALEEHPAVRSSCVIGLPDEDLGNVIHAILETAEAVSDDALREHLDDRLARHKLPRSFERVDEPLRDDAGKLRRSALRAERISG